MLRDPCVIKRSDFWTKLKYLHAIEAVDIGYTNPDCKQAILKWIPYLYEGCGMWTPETLLHTGFGAVGPVSSMKTDYTKFDYSLEIEQIALPCNH